MLIYIIYANAPKPGINFGREDLGAGYTALISPDLYVYIL